MRAVAEKRRFRLRRRLAGKLRRKNFGQRLARNIGDFHEWNRRHALRIVFHRHEILRKKFRQIHARDRRGFGLLVERDQFPGFGVQHDAHCLVGFAELLDFRGHGRQVRQQFTHVLLIPCGAAGDFIEAQMQHVERRAERCFDETPRSGRHALRRFRKIVRDELRRYRHLLTRLLLNLAREQDVIRA